MINGSYAFAAPNPQWVAQQQDNNNNSNNSFYASRGATLFGCKVNMEG